LSRRLDGGPNQFAEVVYEISGGEFAVGVGQRRVPRYVDETECRFDARTRVHGNRLKDCSAGLGIGFDRELASIEFAQDSIGAFEVGLDLVAAPFIYDFAPHRIPCIGGAVASGRQSAPHVVNTFTEDNLYHVDALAQDDNVQRLSRCGYANRNLFVVHTIAR